LQCLQNKVVNFVWLVIVCIGGFQSGLYY
jgi:hypothetical protein